MTIKTTTKALMGTAVSFAMLGTAGLATAADLDNLTDDDLLARIERLEKIIGPGDKTAVRGGNNKVRVTLSGQLSELALGFTDGDDVGVGFGTNINSGTRARFLGEADVTKSLTFGSVIEFQFQGNTAGEGRTTSANISQTARNTGGSSVNDSLAVRLANVYFDHDRYGRVTLGQHNTASNGTAEVDLSGTSIVTYSSYEDIGGGLFLRANASNGVAVNGLSNIRVGTGFANFDGASRNDGVRYTSPTFAGFQAAASYVSNATGPGYNASLRYKNKDLYGFGVQAAVGYTNANSATGSEDSISSSASIIHKATGFNLTGAFSEDNDDGRAIYGKVGWIGSLNSFGKTAFAADVFYGEEQFSNNVSSVTVNGVTTAVNLDDSESIGFGFYALQRFDAAATEVYIGYRNISVDDLEQNGVEVVSFDDINLFYTGARLKF